MRLVEPFDPAERPTNITKEKQEAQANPHSIIDRKGRGVAIKKED